MTNTNKHKPRQYRRMTPIEIAKFRAKEYELGNGSAAIREIYATHLNPSDRAFRMRRKSEQESPLQYIDNQLEQIGIDAINRIGKMVNSSDEQIATKNAQFIVDHLKGKATSKTIGVSVKASVQDLLR